MTTNQLTYFFHSKPIAKFNLSASKPVHFFASFFFIQKFLLPFGVGGFLLFLFCHSLIEVIFDTKAEHDLQAADGLLQQVPMRIVKRLVHRWKTHQKNQATQKQKDNAKPKLFSQKIQKSLPPTFFCRCLCPHKRPFCRCLCPHKRLIFLFFSYFSLVVWE